jgi:hypothetical protein
VERAEQIAPTLNEIEPALRALRQARERMAQT